MYDRKYIYEGITDRIGKLEDRYRMYCNGVNEMGEDLSPGGAAVARSKAKTDMSIIYFVEELMGHIEHDFELSPEAAKGYEKLIEPYERHRNFRQ
jgi:hypothetical protein